MTTPTPPPTPPPGTRPGQPPKTPRYPGLPEGRESVTVPGLAPWDQPDQRGNINPGVKIDTSMASVAPPGPPTGAEVDEFLQPTPQELHAAGFEMGRALAPQFRAHVLDQLYEAFRSAGWL